MNFFSVFAERSGGSFLAIVQRSMMRGVGRILSIVAPGIACKVAAWIWCSPPRSKTDSGRLPEGTKPLKLRVGGRVAQGFLCAPIHASGSRILMQHGWGGSVAKMSALIEALVGAGETVIAFDAFGHGKTGWGRHGWRQSSLTEMSDLVQAIDQELGPFDAVVTHSAGAAATARALRRGMRVSRVVFLAPLADPLGQTHVLSDALGLTPAVATRWPSAMLDSFQTSRADIDTVCPPRADWMPDTLIIQDQDDRFSPPEGAKRLHDAWVGSTLIETRGLGHSRIYRDPVVLREIANFLVPEQVRAPHETISSLALDSILSTKAQIAEQIHQTS